VRRDLEWDDEYEGIVNHIRNKTMCETNPKGTFFWYKPRTGFEVPQSQHIDRALRKNIEDRVKDGATNKQLLANFDQQMHKLSGDRNKDRNTITKFFTSKNFLWD